MMNWYSSILFILLFFNISCNSDSTPFDTQGMAFIQGGTFRMGTNRGTTFEQPVHSVTVKSFWMDRHEVTVADFERMVQATGYVTEAEKWGWSGVFDTQKNEWTAVNGASWRYPKGKNHPPAKPNEPVIQVSWNDANAYARWAGKRLPTEAEWEYAARGGSQDKIYAWGNELQPSGTWMGNWWQGFFPDTNTVADGFAELAPVGSFPPNAYGLYDIAGNVWEWTSDWFSNGYLSKSFSSKEKVIRGGSWLCCDNYCAGYRVAARQKTPIDSGLNNLGFRCVATAKQSK